MSLNIDKKAREPRPHHVLKHPQGITHGTLFLYYILHFRLQEFLGKFDPCRCFRIRGC